MKLGAGEKSLSRNAIVNGAKNVVSVLFPLITYPYVTRILGASGVGRVTFAASIVSYFFLIAQFGITSYAVREGCLVRDDKTKLEQFVSEIYTLNLTTMLAAYILLAITVLIVPSLHEYAVLIGVLSLEFVFYIGSTEWINTVYEDFFYIAVRSILVQVATLAYLFLFVRHESDLIHYAVFLLLSYVGTGVANYVYTRKKLRVKPTTHPNFRKHLKPALMVFIMSITSTIYLNSDQTMLGFMCGDSSVGVYSVAVKIYSTVKAVFNAMLTVVLPRLSYLAQKEDKTEYRSLRKKIMFAVLALLVPACAGLFMLAPLAVRIVGGEEFMAGVVPLRILSVALFFSVMSIFLTNVIVIPSGKYNLAMTASVITAVLNVGMNFFMIPAYAETGAAITTIIAEFIMVAFPTYVIIQNRDTILS